MNLTITPAPLSGTITPPPSKSEAHRLIIAAALAHGTSRLSNVAYSQDIEATLSCMEALGAEIRREGDTLIITGVEGGPMSPLRKLPHPRMDCGESGSTLRFLIPVALALRGGGVFSGRGRLMARPQGPYFDLFDQRGIAREQEGDTLTLSGLLTSGAYILPGNVSSQFVTGLLYALPLLEGDSILIVRGTLESADYVSMTMEVLRMFGITIHRDPHHTFRIPGGQRYRSCDVEVEADWSQAGFWYGAAGMGHRVSVTGMNLETIQGDRVFLAWARRLLEEAQRGKPLTFDVSHAPDLVPPLAMLAAVTEGAKLHIDNAARLRTKESDRLVSVTAALGAMGADITELSDGLLVLGRPLLEGGCTVDSHNDHRIAMMTAIAATRCAAPVELLDAHCVAKSYPNFWEDYAALGGQAAEG